MALVPRRVAAWSLAAASALQKKATSLLRWIFFIKLFFIVIN